MDKEIKEVKNQITKPVVKLNLYEKIQAVSMDIKNIEKNLTVGDTKYGGYKAVAEMDVLREVKKAEVLHKVMSMPIKQELLNSNQIHVFNKKGEEVLNYVDTIKMTVRIFDLEAPENFIDVESLAKGIDKADKGLGKASTYARKYALLNSYKIITGEDLDEEKSEEAILKTNEKLILVLNNTNEERQAKIKHHFKKSVQDLSNAELDFVIRALQKEGVIDV